MKNAGIYLIYIRDCINRIETYTVEGKDQFFQDLRTQDAVLRNLETLADASQKLPETWRSSESTIDWVGITEFRNFLVHQYLEINLDIVWRVVTEELPPLKIAIDRIAERFWS